MLGYRCANSGMTLACGTRHSIDTGCDVEVSTQVSARPGQDRVQRARHRRRADPDHQARHVPLLDRRARRGTRRPLHALARPRRDRRHRRAPRRTASSASTASGRRPTSSCAATTRRSRRCAGTSSSSPRPSARTQEQGIAAKGVTGGGYDGHYFWDTEVYVVPFLAYTDQEAARKVVRFRWAMLDAARTAGGRDEPGRRAVPVADDQRRGGVGVLRRRHRAVPHQRGGRVRVAPLPRGLRRRRLPRPRGRRDARRDGAAVGRPRASTARNGSNVVPHPSGHRARRVHDGRQRQHVHERHGALQPALRRPHGPLPGRVESTKRSRRSGATPTSTSANSTTGMPPPMRCSSRSTRSSASIPRTRRSSNSSRGTGRARPPSNYPLLLHYHPLVIYRHQVLKQADVVLATFLRREHFSAEQKRRNFDYYDPITTGDSSLSACVQSIVAAEVGYDDAGARLLPPVALPRPVRRPRQHRRGRARRQSRVVSGPASSTDSPAWSSTAITSSSRRACRNHGTASRSISAATVRRCGSTSTTSAAAHRPRRHRRADP